MNDEQFEICLDFHLELIRGKPKRQTIDDAYHNKYDNLTAARRVAAISLRESLVDRMKSLKDWYHTANDDRCEWIYNENNSRNPSSGAFDGAWSVIRKGAGISEAAKDNGVNYQSVKVLIPRLQRWDEYANRLHATL
jgi:hypothetical protein